MDLKAAAKPATLSEPCGSRSVRVSERGRLDVECGEFCKAALGLFWKRTRRPRSRNECHNVFERWALPRVSFKLHGKSDKRHLADRGRPAAQPVIGADDFNGDGRSDILLRNTDGTPQMWLMNATSVTASATLAHPAASWHPNTG
jgi:hypothetical protein